MMHGKNEGMISISSPIQMFARRPLILISGVIAFFLVSALLDVAGQVIALPEWKSPLANVTIMRVLFYLLILHGLFWIGGSLAGLRALARDMDLQTRLQQQWLFQHPILVQIVAFVEHGVVALLYILLTGDEKRGVILASLLILHVAVALLFAPRMVRTSPRG